MTFQQMQMLSAHFDKYFEDKEPTVLHMQEGYTPHIDVFLYSPTPKYPFWKMVTVGASDIKMPSLKGGISDRNEYMMFIAPEVDLKDSASIRYYYNKLLSIAYYPLECGTSITYGHSVEWAKEDDSDMVGAFLELPQMIEDTGILRCRLGIFKKAACLQVVLLTRSEMDRRLKIGSEKFSEFLYPDDGEPHYLCERYRTDKF